MYRAEDLRRAGYDDVLGSADPALSHKVRELTGGLGADVAWDCVGGQDFFSRAVASVRLGGTVAVLAAPLGETSARGLKMAPTLFITGQYNIVSVRASTRRDQEIVVDLLAKGHVKPVIDNVMPLAEAQEAHALLESRQQVGKIVLVP